MPENRENLVGKVTLPSALAVAFSPIEPAPAVPGIRPRRPSDWSARRCWARSWSPTPAACCARPIRRLGTSGPRTAWQGPVVLAVTDLTTLTILFSLTSVLAGLGS